MSLEQLQQAIPPPPRPVETSAPGGWEAVEAALGTALPSEYKALISTYGTGGFNEFLYVFNPFAANRYRNLLTLKDDILRAYATSRAGFPDAYPDPPFPEPGGLLPWARTDNGDEFYWKTDGQPDAWSIVVIKSRNSAQFRYALPITDFLHRLLTNQLEPPVFSPDLFEDSKPYFIAAA
jgi:hypothetical protein